MDFVAEADRIFEEAIYPFDWPNNTKEDDAKGLGIIANALRRAYEAGAADALVKKLDAIAGDDWAPATQEGA